MVHTATYVQNLMEEDSISLVSVPTPIQFGFNSIDAPAYDFPSSTPVDPNTTFPFNNKGNRISYRHNSSHMV